MISGVAHDFVELAVMQASQGGAPHIKKCIQIQTQMQTQRQMQSQTQNQAQQEQQEQQEHAAYVSNNATSTAHYYTQNLSVQHERYAAFVRGHMDTNGNVHFLPPHEKEQLVFSTHLLRSDIHEHHHARERKKVIHPI